MRRLASPPLLPLLGLQAHVASQDDQLKSWRSERERGWQKVKELVQILIKTKGHIDLKKKKNGTEQ